ncbi:MAG: peptidoglycan DD-metalloendopeptidase family protein [Halioglobus sp.]
MALRLQSPRILWPVLLGLALVSLLTPALISAQDQSEKEQARRELSQLQAQIDKVSAEISSARTRQNKLQTELKNSEMALGTLQKSLRDNTAAIADASAELQQLQTRKTGLESARQDQQTRIASELETAWKMGQQGQLKVLLNQEDPDTVARTMAYYRYFFEARTELLAGYRATLSELEQVAQGIVATTDTLESRQNELRQQQLELVSAQNKRKATVALLNADIKSKGASLKNLQQNRLELERLLETIEQAVVNLQIPDNYQPFAAARGIMPWPVKGKNSNRFGRPRNEGKMKWQGINITAKEGDTVGAIHHGRVVYADWFRGSGLLLIVDHGDGYMSLYAHNQALLREVGEWVSAGTPISTVGDSGGLTKAALYFEIRHNGKPTNPANWCRS